MGEGDVYVMVVEAAKNAQDEHFQVMRHDPCSALNVGFSALPSGLDDQAVNLGSTNVPEERSTPPRIPLHSNYTSRWRNKENEAWFC